MAFVSHFDAGVDGTDEEDVGEDDENADVGGLKGEEELLNVILPQLVDAAGVDGPTKKLIHLILRVQSRLDITSGLLEGLPLRDLSGVVGTDPDHTFGSQRRGLLDIYLSRNLLAVKLKGVQTLAYKARRRPARHIWPATEDKFRHPTNPELY
ncbi:hypothetical protein EYF80_006785 [Liparis tanakae]|uniref:Uncharacterized protein n=1 Tax=Liparis tanakae TaxID=230148 RepID=A0A4Z2IZA2_9TELE|nr:hypothetical protein EYF80_006785 [Liparis tanakae]